MIAINSSDNAERQIFVVKGNVSMSWRGNVYLALSFGAVGCLFGLGLALQGYWLVLPFAGLEALVVLCSLRAVWRRLERREVITISDQSIRVEWGRKEPEQSIEFNRHWARLEFDLPDSPFETGTLRLRCHGRSVVLGNALGREEKKTLHVSLKENLAAWARHTQLSAS